MAAPLFMLLLPSWGKFTENMHISLNALHMQYEMFLVKRKRLGEIGLSGPLGNHQGMGGLTKKERKGRGDMVMSCRKHTGSDVITL